MRTAGQFFLALLPCLAILVLGVPLALLVHRVNRRWVRGRENELEGLFLHSATPPSHEPVDDLWDVLDLIEQSHGNE